MFYKKTTYENGSFKDLIRDCKIVHITNCPNFSNELFLNIAKNIGDYVPINEDIVTGDKNGELLIDVRYDCKKSDVFRHSNTAQPLHTDASYESNTPDIVFFYCVKQADTGGDTLFLDAIDLVYLLKKINEPLLDQLINVKVRFKKGNDYKERSIISYDHKGILLTWNYYRVEKTDLNEEMIENFANILDKMKDHFFHVNIKPNDILLFQDERLLHGRESFVGNRFIWKAGIKYL